MNNNCIDFKNLGYIIEDVPEILLDSLKQEINKKLDSYNKNLAGNIKKEFYLPKAIPIFNNYLMGLARKYDDNFGYFKNITYCNNDAPLILENMWVNFQKKHEFNPVHVHKGIFSFVIWLQVPYEIEYEKANSPGKDGNHNLAGCFQFHFLNILGEFSELTLPVDRRFEGKICFFPARLSHSVNPFYSSDDYRISIAGNISLQTPK